jgi:hypothetical protein
MSVRQSSGLHPGSIGPTSAAQPQPRYRQKASWRISLMRRFGYGYDISNYILTESSLLYLFRRQAKHPNQFDNDLYEDICHYRSWWYLGVDF